MMATVPDDEWLAANRSKWDDRTEVHLRSQFYDVEGWLRDERGPQEWEIEAIGDVAGLRLVHLQCHFGLDTLSWARRGAEVTGLDFSPPAIEAAEELARRADLSERARFVCADVYEAASALAHQTFDIVYVSLGALCWLPSVERWAAQIAALLRPGGRLYLHDQHPLCWALSFEEPVIEHTYFEEDAPFVEDSTMTYTDAYRALVATRSFEWNHSLGEIVNSLVGHGLRIDRLDEHDWTLWLRYPWLQKDNQGRWRPPPDRPRIPLSFTVLATAVGT
jgi:SAM-dependent methyltransferase